MVNFTSCFNDGFPSNPNKTIVNGSLHVGGIVGYCENCTMNKVGVERGTVSGFEVPFNTNYIATKFFVEKKSTRSGRYSGTNARMVLNQPDLL